MLSRLPVGLRRGVTNATGISLTCLALGLLVANVPTRTSWINATGACAVIAGAAALYPIVKRGLLGTLDIFEPILWGSAMLLSLFAVRPLVMLIGGNITYGNLIDVRQTFPRAVFLGTLGTLALVAGYELTPTLWRRRTDRRVWTLTDDRVWSAVKVLTGVGLVVFFVRLATQGNPLAALLVLLHGRSASTSSGNVSAYLDDGPLLLACAATVAIVGTGGRLSRRDTRFVALLVLGAVAAFSLLGNRRLILPSIGSPIVAYYLLAGRRPKWRSVALVVPVAFILLATIPFERSLGARQNSGGAGKIFLSAFEAPFQPISEFFSSYDTAMIPALALEINGLRGGPHAYYFGRATVGDLLLSPVPSALIPGKPVTARNSLLIRLFGVPCDAPGSSCPDFSAVGTFYQDFWYFGVVVGMFLMGALSSALWENFRATPRSPVAILLAASWAVALPITIRAGFMPAFQWWLEFIVPSILALRIANRPHDAPARGAIARGPDRRIDPL